MTKQEENQMLNHINKDMNQNEKQLYKNLLFEMTSYLNDSPQTIEYKNKALGKGYALIDDFLYMKLITEKQAETMKRQYKYWLYKKYKKPTK